MSLIRAGEGDEAILYQLEEAGLRDVGSLALVRRVRQEYQVAKSLMPAAPPRRRIRLFGAVMAALGLAGMGLSWFAAFEVHSRYDPFGYGFILAILGAVLLIWPDKASDEW
ncbi:MAG: hypothetical protein L3J39_11385 [Verrucomicrobiales bacterium]|nr:hypothetical protein [Verrucomicrobiales bacterium]